MTEKKIVRTEPISGRFRPGGFLPRSIRRLWRAWGVRLARSWRVGGALLAPREKPVANLAPEPRPRVSPRRLRPLRLILKPGPCYGIANAGEPTIIPRLTVIPEFAFVPKLSSSPRPAVLTRPQTGDLCPFRPGMYGTPGDELVNPDAGRCGTRFKCDLTDFRNCLTAFGNCTPHFTNRLTSLTRLLKCVNDHFVRQVCANWGNTCTGQILHKVNQPLFVRRLTQAVRFGVFNSVPLNGSKPV